MINPASVLAPVPTVSQPPAAANPNAVIMTDVPPEPDVNTTVLNLGQLRQAILNEAELTKDDVDAFKLTNTADIHGTPFILAKILPGTEWGPPPVDPEGKIIGPIEPLPPTQQQYIFAMFVHNNDPDGDTYVPGDVRVYTTLMSQSDAKAREWRLFTFNRVHQSYFSQTMNQATFIQEIAGEYLELDSLANPTDDDEGDDGAEPTGN
jgi:hypothetical protein